MTTTQQQFIEILRQDIEHFEAQAKRIEELLLQLGRDVQCVLY